MISASVLFQRPIERPTLIVGVGASLLVVSSAWISPLLMPIVAGILLLAAISLRHPWLGVALLVASVPIQQIGAVAGLTATRAALIIALATWAAALLVQREPVRGTRLMIPFLVLIVWMIATIPVARDPRASGAEVFRWVIALIAFMLAMQFLADSPRRRLILFILVIALVGALEAMAGTVLGLIGFGPASFAVAGSISRAYGSFGRPNSFAGYLEISLFPALWLGVYMLTVSWSRARRYREARLGGFAASRSERWELARAVALAVVLGGSAGVMLLGVLISFSRGAWVGVAAGLGISGLLALRRRIVIALALAPAAVLVLGLVVMTVAPTTLTGRLASIADEARPFDASSIPITPDNFAVVERMAHWQAGWHMFEDHPLTGVGIGNFNARYPDYFVRTEFRFSQGHAHNYYIHTLAETGIIGLIAYLTTATGFLVLAVIVALRSTDAMARFVALGSAGTMTAVYVHNVFENLHVLNLGILISVTWAMSVVAHRMWRRSDPDVTDVHEID
ncbi:MAG TPA: O-antigen ligase family protein [Thermomicrobiales bacterium]|nr:O-antigen ligase family protein [Thermomicrobiales bacterium]